MLHTGLTTMRTKSTDSMSLCIAHTSIHGNENGMWIFRVIDSLTFSVHLAKNALEMLYVARCLQCHEVEFIWNMWTCEWGAYTQFMGTIAVLGIVAATNSPYEHTLLLLFAFTLNSIVSLSSQCVFVVQHFSESLGMRMIDFLWRDIA